MEKGVIIQSSSRKNGDTNTIVNSIKLHTNFDVLHLADYTIGHFDYNFANTKDDFNLLFKHIVTNYNYIIFATPVYWYAMSGRLKVFFDRISDFLNHEKDFGRQLRGKTMSSISVSNDSEFFEGFEMSFINSANYLGMIYKGHQHTWVENNLVPGVVSENLQEFCKQIAV